MYFTLLINWMSLFPIEGLCVFIETLQANSENPERTPHRMAFDLHCLPISHKKWKGKRLVQILFDYYCNDEKRCKFIARESHKGKTTIWLL